MMLFSVIGIFIRSFEYDVTPYQISLDLLRFPICFELINDIDSVERFDDFRRRKSPKIGAENRRIDANRG